MTSVLGKQICMQMLINIKFKVEETKKYRRKIFDFECQVLSYMGHPSFLIHPFASMAKFLSLLYLS